MAQQDQARRTMARPRESVDLGATWWVALAVVAGGLAVLGRGLVGGGARGFLSVFLWNIVGFVVGSLVAIATTATAAKSGSHRASGRQSRRLPYVS